MTIVEEQQDPFEQLLGFRRGTGHKDAGSAPTAILARMNLAAVVDNVDALLAHAKPSFHQLGEALVAVSFNPHAPGISPTRVVVRSGRGPAVGDGVRVWATIELRLTDLEALTDWAVQHHTEVWGECDWDRSDVRRVLFETVVVADRTPSDAGYMYLDCDESSITILD